MFGLVPHLSLIHISTDAAAKDAMKDAATEGAKVATDVAKDVKEAADATKAAVEKK